MENEQASITVMEKMVRAFGSQMSDPRERFKKQTITDLPIMLTDSGKILCIQDTGEVKIIGITGMSGSCKTVLMNYLTSMEKWVMKKVCIHLNDMQKETFEWSEPAEKETILHKKIHIKPIGSPIVYVFPSTETLRIEKRDENYPNLRMTIPVKEVMRNIQNYLMSDLKGSELYLTNLLTELEECTSMIEIDNLLMEKFPEKGQNLMRLKMSNIFQKIFNAKMLNVSEPEAPAFLRYQDAYIKENIYRPTVQTIMRAGLIPSIQTQDLFNQDYFAPYLSYIVDTIYNSQYDDPFFKSKSVSLFVDEIDKLWQDEKGEIVKKSLNRIATNGRAARIGLRWCTQHYDKVTTQIKHNTKILLCGAKKDAKEVLEISKDFSMDKKMQENILKLKSDPANGIFRMVAMTKENFVTYDLDNGKKEYTDEPQMGFIINPLANHMVPWKKAKEFKEL